MKKEIPVLLLTGYLGSGKTTLLNRILSNRKGIRFAVIVNDIGEVNIDAELIEKGGVVGQNDDSLVALQNGCICCTLKMDLVQQIYDLTRMEKFDYIVIEASGICEPEPIAQTICSIPEMAPAYTKYGVAHLDCVVTVVDALRMADEFKCGENLLRKGIGEEDIENLVIQQIEFCNIILLNKASELSKEDLGRVRSIVRTLQPVAKIIECDYGNIELDNILFTNLFDFEKTAVSATWVSKVDAPEDELEEDEREHHHHHHDNDDDDEHEEHEHDEHDEHEEGHHHHHHHHDHEHNHEGGEVEEYGIGTFVYYRRKPFDMNAFDHFVDKEMPKGVIRVKGMCYFWDEYDTCYVFEEAGRQITLRNAGLWFATMPADELEAMKQRDKKLRDEWHPLYGDRMQKLVFIGQHLDKEAIAKGLDACLMA